MCDILVPANIRDDARREKGLRDGHGATLAIVAGLAHGGEHAGRARSLEDPEGSTHGVTGYNGCWHLKGNHVTAVDQIDAGDCYRQVHRIRRSRSSSRDVNPSDATKCLIVPGKLLATDLKRVDEAILAGTGALPGDLTDESAGTIELSDGSPVVGGEETAFVSGNGFRNAAEVAPRSLSVTAPSRGL
jgi:hypothetical protein